jgi:hypothetical protein
VLLHVQRLGLDLPLRATSEADFGIPPHRLRDLELVGAIEALGYANSLRSRYLRASIMDPRYLCSSSVGNSPGVAQRHCQSDGVR